MRLLVDSRFQAAMRVLFWLAAAFSVIMALVPISPYVTIENYSDKVAHILAFGTLTLLAGLGFPGANRWRIAERLSFLGAMIEVVQSMPGLGRDCDIRDWISDTAAVLVVTVLLALVLPRLQETADRAR